MRTTLRRSRLTVVAAVGIALAAASGVAAAKVLPDRHAGPRPDGSAITTYGWRVTPAGSRDQARGEAVRLGPQPDGKYLAISNDGTRTQSLSLVEAATGKVLQSLPNASPQSLFIGLAWSPDGSKLYAAAGGNDKIRVYTRAGGLLTEIPSITLPKGSFPSGLAVSADGAELFVADNGSGAMSAVDTATGAVLGTVATGPNPFTVGLTGDGADGVRLELGYEHGLGHRHRDPDVRKTLTVGSHPTAIIRNPATGELLVAVTDADKVSVSTRRPTRSRGRSTSRRTSTRRWVRAPGPGHHPERQDMYVANAGNNDVAVVDLAPRGGRAGHRTGPDRLVPDHGRTDPGRPTAVVTNAKDSAPAPTRVVPSRPTRWWTTRSTSAR